MTDSCRKLNLEYDLILKVKNWYNFDHLSEKIQKTFFNFLNI
jgi:hypothetical protein